MSGVDVEQLSTIPRDTAERQKTFLLIADSFYPKELPPEAKTNTFLAIQLAQRGWRVAIWGGKPALVPKVENIEIVREVTEWSVFELLRLTAWICIHRPYRVGLCFFAGGYSMKSHINWIPLFARCLRISCVTLFTNKVPPRRSMIQDYLTRIVGQAALLRSPAGILSASTTMVFFCEADRNFLVPFANENRVVIASPTTIPPDISLMVSQQHNATAVLKKTNHFLLGYFGLLYPQKGLEWLLHAIDINRKKGLEIQLVVIGGSAAVSADSAWNTTCREYEADMRALTRELGIDDLVSWTGYLDDPEACRIILGCSAICLPFNDGVKIHRSSFVECAKLGVAIITTLSDESDQCFQATDTGMIFVEPRDAGQIASAIRRLHDDAALRSACRAKVREFASVHLDQKKLVDGFDI